MNAMCRSTSVSSLLSRAKSFSNLPTSGDAPVNQDVITESLQAVPSSSERDRGSGVDTSALGDGAFLGRFVLDKNGTNQHTFVWEFSQISNTCHDILKHCPLAAATGMQLCL